MCRWTPYLRKLILWDLTTMDPKLNQNTVMQPPGPRGVALLGQQETH